MNLFWGLLMLTAMLIGAVGVGVGGQELLVLTGLQIVDQVVVQVVFLT
jgi:hypothetical protein